LFFSLQSFFSLLSVTRDHHRFRVLRSFRMWILSSSRTSPVVDVVVLQL
jgi:hypothetical protein